MVKLRRSLPATETNRVSKCSLTTVYAVIVGPSNICSFSFFFFLSVLFPRFSHVTSATQFFDSKKTISWVYAIQRRCKTKTRSGYGLCLQFEDPRGICTRRRKLCLKREGLWHQTASSAPWHHVSKTSFGVSAALPPLLIAAGGALWTTRGPVMGTERCWMGCQGGETVCWLFRGKSAGIIKWNSADVGMERNRSCVQGWQQVCCACAAGKVTPCYLCWHCYRAQGERQQHQGQLMKGSGAKRILQVNDWYMLEGTCFVM